MEEPAHTSALEQFRQQWRDEVNARTKRSVPKPGNPDLNAVSLEDVKPDRTFIKAPTHYPAAGVTEEANGSEPVSDGESSGLIERIEGLSVRSVDDDDFSARGSSIEPRSALEHYERGVEKESQGNLGDSLSHYRKAYRLDAKVDQSYKNKHFPAKSKPSDPNPSGAPSTVPSTAHHSSKEPTETLTTSELVESFSGVSILGSEPVIEGDHPPPCPIKDLPHEVLLEVLLRVAIVDPASFIRLSSVCRKLAYHVWTDSSIWKRVALGSEFGLASQIYDFTTDLQGRESIDRLLESPYVSPTIDDEAFSKHENWREFFHSYPRIRFTGVYISTVNYTRAGHGSASQATWNSPVHIVTYYRYLRFFRNGTVLSLLTTSEPIDVVHHLTPENVTLVRSSGKDHPHPLNFTSSAPALVGGAKEGTNAAPPSAQHLMKHALRGRWRMCPPSSATDSVSDIAARGSGESGDLHIETEGAGPRYMYTLHLSLKSSSKAKHAVKNNKLQWKGFWSYNSLTDDWAEFQLRNDKAFFFSRVKSYGLGY